MFPRIQWTVRRKVLAAMLVLAALALTFCNPLRWRTPHMTPLSPRLQALFENTEAVCFGRFLIDVPKGTRVAWGRAEVPLTVYVYPGEADKHASIVAKREEELKAKIRYPNGAGLFLYERTVPGPRRDQATVVSYKSFASQRRSLESYFPLDGHLFQINASSFDDEIPRSIAKLQEFSQRLRARAPDEVPTEPGVCIDHAFRVDRPELVNKYEQVEHVRVGLRMPAPFDDVHLSIYVAPANPHNLENDSLKGQSLAAKANPEAAAALARIRIFRESERSIGGWTTGYEVLSRSPKGKVATSYHEFLMKFTGVAEKDPLRPFADIQMQSGVKDDQAGAAEPSLSDEEAIALWDKLTGSIRVRPTGTAAPKKTSDSSPPPSGPVRAATGQPCPVSGVWTCEDHGSVCRLHVRAGEIMPKGVFPGPRSLRQKLRGERPTYPLTVVWTLVQPDDNKPDAQSR